jgi:hypothetical protein
VQQQGVVLLGLRPCCCRRRCRRRCRCAGVTPASAKRKHSKTEFWYHQSFHGPSSGRKPERVLSPDSGLRSVSDVNPSLVSFDSFRVYGQSPHQSTRGCSFRHKRQPGVGNTFYSQAASEVMCLLSSTTATARTYPCTGKHKGPLRNIPPTHV